MTQQRGGAQVDVVLPVRDSAAHLATSLESLLAQEFSDLRVLVIDDGSQDDSAALAERLATRDGRVQVFRRPPLGLVAALNFGLAQASAPLLARQDADDISYPQRLALQLRYLAEHPDCVAISARFDRIGDADEELGESWWPMDPDLADPDAMPSRPPLLPHPFAVLRRDALQAVGGYRPIRHAEDVDLWWRLAGPGRLAVLPDRLGSYREHAQSISNRSIRDGRLQALGSELAALMAQRRRAGLAEPPIDADLFTRLARQTTLPGMLSQIAPLLSGAEARWLAGATSLKLLEFGTFRHYRLERGDIRFIRGLLPTLPARTGEERHAAQELLRRALDTQADRRKKVRRAWRRRLLSFARS